MRLPVADSRTTLRRLAGLVRQYRGSFALVIGLQVVVAGLGAAAPMIVGRAIDSVAAGTTVAHIRIVVVALIALVVAQALLGYVAGLRAYALSERILDHLRRRLVWTVTHLPLGTVEAAGAGDLIGRTTHDVDRVSFFLQGAFGNVLMVTLTVVVTLAAAIATDVVLGAVVAAACVPIFFTVRFYLRRAVPAYLAASAVHAGMSGLVAETVEQAGTADAMRLRRSRAGRMDTLIREHWRNELYTGWVRSLYIFMNHLVISAPTIVALAVGAFLIGAGQATYGTVTAVVLYSAQLRMPMWTLGWWFDEMQFALAGFARIFGVEDALGSGEQGGGSVPKGHEVTIDGVHFAYREGQDVLRDVTMSIRQGETVAIVGPSGAGKSTLGRLVAGINEPTRGSVRIGGAEVSGIDEARLHSTVAMVTQEHHVFVGTVADNLRLAKSEATEADMRRALAAVEATWVEDLDEGLNTKVGSGFLALTPPQAQQLALARIILLNPGVLVLDEATSLLDPTAARSLERTLGRVLAGRTVISIAHRLYTAHDADRIAVMIDGRVVEMGSHDELVARGGEYAALWRAWQQD
ncbi:MAG: ABC transporter ATP-binding protein [Actinomycetaceae bacterium]|nr:ABC transporter ATP-binding protein [Actinomycetaceae bacterium]